MQNILVAQMDEIMVGFCSLENGNCIDLLYVHKNFQRRGVARSLYIEIEKLAFTYGSKILTSDVSITAKPFFEKCGCIEKARQYILIKYVEMVNFKMEKVLFQTKI